MKADKGKQIMEVMFSAGYGALIGYELGLQIDNPDMMGLGFCVLLLCVPIVF